MPEDNQPVEIPELRTETAKHFDNGDGTYTAEIHTLPIHFTDNGKLKDIDPTITPDNSDSDFTHKVTDVEMKVGLIDTYDQPNTFSREDFADLVITPLNANSVEGIVNGNLITYEEAYTNVDVTQESTSWGFKETYTLKGPGHPSRFSFEVNSAYTPKHSKSNIVYLDNNDLAYRLKPLVVVNAEEQTILNWRYSGNTVYFDVPEVKEYPLVIDPSVSPYSSAGDGTVSNMTASSSWSNCRNAGTGTAKDDTGVTNIIQTDVGFSGEKGLRRMFWAFDTSSIGSGQAVTAADLKLYGSTTSNYAISDPDLYIVSGSQASTSSLATSDFGSVGSTSFGTKTFASWSGAGYNTISLNSSGQAAINMTGYTKLAGRMGNDYNNTDPGTSFASAYMQAYTSEQSGTSNDPQLVVTYTAASSDKNVSVSDSVTTSESVSRLLESNFNKSDSITISENVSVNIAGTVADLNISVNDSTSITENINRLEESFINVSDSTTVTEQVGRLVEGRVNLSDSTSVSESVSRLLESNFNVNDSSSVTESIGKQLDLSISTSDSVSVTESVTVTAVAVGGITISVSDSASVAENLANGGVPNPSVNDSASLAEAIMVTTEEDPTVMDSLTVSEAVTIYLAFRYVAVSDTTTVSESLKVELNSNLNKSDATSVSENLVITGNLNINVSDSSSVSENIQRLQEGFINKTDSVTVSEAVSALIPTYNIAVSDSSSVSEAVSANVPAPGAFIVSVSETINTAEQVSNGGVPNPSTSDSVSVAEAIMANTDEDPAVMDSLSVNEAINLYITTLFLSVSDNINVAEAVNLVIPTLLVSVNDNVGVSESLKAELNGFINANDVISSTENLVVNLQPVPTLSINQSETVGVSENLSILRTQSYNITGLFGGVLFDPILGTVRSGKVKTVAPPQSAVDVGKKGQVAVDDNYIYICIATNTWVRAGLSTW